MPKGWIDKSKMGWITHIFPLEHISNGESCLFINQDNNVAKPKKFTARCYFKLLIEKYRWIGFWSFVIRPQRLRPRSTCKHWERTISLYGDENNQYQRRCALRQTRAFRKKSLMQWTRAEKMCLTAFWFSLLLVAHPSQPCNEKNAG